jgi:hypothetical protein
MCIQYGRVVSADDAHQALVQVGSLRAMMVGNTRSMCTAAICIFGKH